MKRAHIYLLAACTFLVASCGGSRTSVNTSDLTDREKEWVEFSYTHEKNQDVKRTWEQLPAEGVKSYLEQQIPLLCGDTAALMQSLKKAGYEAGEMQEYKKKTAELIC
ncbi:hypothetical protein E6P78_32320 [Streptomyces sp. A0958]|uniref:hypothetical protein n=1 Tax=Streptomyces sp. A0958 TaxID=2563101 RepID=UPI00109EA5BD|nr:hypothetical protein [Streptomyces sp. A0958]THA56249.1 hypothetical protein E6P78_32320 [Streptomyces sp. A0958]